MATQNSLNCTDTGIINHDGAGTFTGRTVTGTADFIDVANGNGSAGNPTLSIATNFETTGKSSWNGAILETVDISVTSDGATITFSVEQDGGGDLTVVFSDSYYDWDTSPAATATLTAGSDTAPQINYVYFLQSTKTLTVSTAGWPVTEHAPLATVLCQSAASLQTDGAYKVHAWTDHVVGTDNMGHLADLNYWVRQQPATYASGVVQTYTITPNGGAADNVILTTAAGVVLQLHTQTFPAFGGTPDVYVVNDFTTPYTKVTDLNALLTDSNNTTMVGRYFSLVIWGCVSEDTGDCKLFCNLPSGSYNNQTGVEDDVEKYANYTIPADFTGTGFLISEWKLRHQSAAGGTWTSIEEIDLRGLLPSLTAGGGAALATEFPDNTFRVFDDGDDSKKLAFQCSGISPATVRTLTVPDFDGTIATTDVAGGGTGRATATAYAVICGGTTATGAHQSIASVGTAGQVLTSNGAGALPTFQAAAGGTGIVFLSSATASASATLEFTSNIDATYNTYLFVFDHIKPATDAQALFVRTSTDGGVSWDQSTDYNYGWISGTITTLAGSGGTGQTNIAINSNTGNSTNEEISGNLWLYSPSDAAPVNMTWHVYHQNNAGNPVTTSGGAKREASADVDGIQFRFQSGNIASGTIYMYGMTTPS